ncbi:MAG TPA: arginine--tRNA ligase [Firmicutes bacterium]|nr:arginine--tRNA ligase [Bacillota bacterium]
MKQPVFREVQNRLKEEIWQAWAKASQEGLLPEPTGDIEILLEIPKERVHGNFATNLAFVLAKPARRAPREIATILVDKLVDSDLVNQAEVAGPGFINFFLKQSWLNRVLVALVEAPEEYGRVDDLAGKKIQLEFVSANPVGPMNVVNARAGALGDSLARLFKFCGAEVAKEYYINDYGIQVYTLGRSIDARYRELLGQEVVFPEDGYQGEYIYDLARALIEEKGRSLLEMSEEKRIEACRDWGYKKILASQQKDLADYGIIYDQWFSERSLHEAGRVDQVVAEMKERGLLYEEEEAVWFRSTEFGDDKDRVVRTADGRTTYFVADIAYHLNKFARGFDHLINIWGPDHHGYIPRMKAAMAAFGFDPNRLEVLIAQQINLLKEGKPFKMSKRRGEFITMRDLLEEVGNDAARWYFLMRSPDSHLDFDLELAKKETAENPVFYVQYAHARISSIFRQLDGEFIPDPEFIASVVWEDDEKEILEKVAVFPEVVSGAAREREPHRLTNYLLDLATLFHSYYNRKRFLTEEEQLTKARILLAYAVQNVVRNGLGLLGISAPEQM